jgi:two-component system phosphate regulon response regulator OmpR
MRGRRITRPHGHSIVTKVGGASLEPMISRDHHLFIVEDDADLRQMLARYLEQREFGVTAMATAEELLHRVARFEPDLILLDLGLPGMDGMRACQRLRERGVLVPVIVLSARADMLDRVLALETGADDDICTPNAALEVHARVKALLRRVAINPLGSQRPRAADMHGTDAIAIGDRVFSRSAGTLAVNGRQLPLTQRQCALLHELTANPGLSISRERLLAAIRRPGAEGSAAAVDAMIRKLRRLIEPDAGRPRHLRTVRGCGYTFLPDAAPE